MKRLLLGNLFSEVRSGGVYPRLKRLQAGANGVD